MSIIVSFGFWFLLRLELSWKNCPSSAKFASHKKDPLYDIMYIVIWCSHIYVKLLNHVITVYFDFDLSWINQSKTCK